MEKETNKLTTSFKAQRSPCRRQTKDRRRLYFIGGYSGIEKRFIQDRRKGNPERRRSLA